MDGGNMYGAMAIVEVEAWKKLQHLEKTILQSAVLFPVKLSNGGRLSNNMIGI